MRRIGFFHVFAPVMVAQTGEPKGSQVVAPPLSLYANPALGCRPIGVWWQSFVQLTTKEPS